MKTYLVTGAAGFIGANYLKYILAKHDDIRVVVLDSLTYAGNLGTIAGDIDNERCFFVKGDICDRDLADRLFAEYKFDYVVNFAATRASCSTPIVRRLQTRNSRATTAAGSVLSARSSARTPATISWSIYLKIKDFRRKKHERRLLTVLASKSMMVTATRYSASKKRTLKGDETV